MISFFGFFDFLDTERLSNRLRCGIGVQQFILFHRGIGNKNTAVRIHTLQTIFAAF